MKKLFIAAIALGLFVSVSSCGKKQAEAESKEEIQEVETTTTQEATTTEDAQGEETAAVYQCPMKCEGEKTYSEPGTCPKCNMELKELAQVTEGTGEDHGGH